MVVSYDGRSLLGWKKFVTVVENGYFVTEFVILMAEVCGGYG